MDPHDFDTLARVLGTAAPRRGLAPLLVGIAIAPLRAVLRPDEGAMARARNKKKKPCRPYGAACKPSKPEQCCSRRCSRQSKTCLCTKTAQCSPASDPCQITECLDSQCQTRVRNNGTECGPFRKCSGGVCGEPPNCQPTGALCGGDGLCCSHRCEGVSAKQCLCSAFGMPCLNVDQDANPDCCPNARGQVPCIGYYCGGCRAAGQPCDENGSGCCTGLLCQGGVCKRPGPG
jgi:hypothetical protein